MSPEPEPLCLTPAEVADLLRVKSVKSVYRWAKKDASMPKLQLGGTIRFPRVALLRWLEDRTQGMARARRPPITHQVPTPTKAPGTQGPRPRPAAMGQVVGQD